jgi:hypothetical protein
MLYLYENLELADVTRIDQALVKDYLVNDLEDFVFRIFAIGPEFENFQKRQDELKKLKESWPYYRY